MTDVISFAFIVLLGAMSPGPDFAIVTRYALINRTAALNASLGISIALLIHATYSSLGVAILLLESPVLFRIIQGLGSLYLGYLGLRLLFPSGGGTTHAPPSSKRAFFSGFMTNLLNPKATLFVFGLFTQFTDKETSNWMLATYTLTLVCVCMAWFSSLTLLMTHRSFKHHFARWQNGLMKIMGVILIGLAAYVLYQAILSTP